MRKILILLMAFFTAVSQVAAYDLVFPKERKNIVNTNYAFFVGKARKNEHISINDENIYVAPNGAFAHTVKLKTGENRIVIKTDYNKKIYRFYKNIQPEVIKPKLEEFDSRQAIVLKDNTPLRNTPVDMGMNRVSHLFAGTNIIINGQKNGFYRVYLSKNKEAWISKEAVCENPDKILEPKFITTNSETFKNASVNTIEFTERLPYTIEENEKEIFFKVYNPFIDGNSVYTINVKKPLKYYYKTTLNGGTYMFKLNSLPYCDDKSLEGLTVVVDPGHGGSESGAIGCLGDKEKDINLLIASELKTKLEEHGANVLMTRECDGYVSLEDRVNIAKDNFANIFISIHLNSIPDIKMNIHKNRGTSVYYYNQNSKKLAEEVLNSLTETIKTKDDGVRTASFAVIRPTDYVGILVETAYMTNPLDSMIYKSKTFYEDTANGILEGILRYTNSDK